MTEYRLEGKLQNKAAAACFAVGGEVVGGERGSYAGTWPWVESLFGSTKNVENADGACTHALKMF